MEIDAPFFLVGYIKNDEKADWIRMNEVIPSFSNDYEAAKRLFQQLKIPYYIFEIRRNIKWVEK